MFMNPYQEATDEQLRQNKAPGEAVKKGAQIAANIAAFGGGGLIGSEILSRILPFLNKKIAPSLAIKGLTKIDPRFGKIINSALKTGYTFDDVVDHLQKIVKDEGIEGAEKQPGELSRESLQQQFSQGYPQAAQQPGIAPQGQGQGKGALAPIVAEAIKILRSLKRSG